MRIRIGLLLCFSLCACSKQEEYLAKYADAESGVLAETLDAQQRSRLQLIGRTAAPTRYTERTDDNRIRVVAIDFGGVKLGQCADDVGNLLPASCLPPDSELAPDLECTLSSGMFRQYSTQVSTSVDTSIAVALLGVSGQTYYSHNFFVLEWRRYCLQSPDDWGPAAESTFVSGIEKGVAVRIIFDVKLTTLDAKLAVNFGLAYLSTALARNEARVEVSYEILGTTLDLVPSKALIVTSLSEYLDAIDEFYRAVKIVSSTSGMLPPNYADLTAREQPPVRSAKDHALSRQIFPLSTLAYYVSGPNVGANYDALSNVAKCQAYTAKDGYLLSDIGWTWHGIAARERTIERSAEKRAWLRKERKRLADLRTERRVLAALSAELNCQRACAAESARIEYVKTMMAREQDEHAAWEQEIARELKEAHTARDQAREALEAARKDLVRARKNLARARKTRASKDGPRNFKKHKALADQAKSAVDQAEEKWWRTLDTIEWLEGEEVKRSGPRETLFTRVPCRPVDLDADTFGLSRPAASESPGARAPSASRTRRAP